MNILKTVLLILVLSAASFGQIALNQTTLNGAVAGNVSQITLTSVSGINVGAGLYVIDFGQTRGELMRVTAVNNAISRVSVSRSGNVTPHVNGARVVIGPTMVAFQAYNPGGACPTVIFPFTPWINTLTGEQWICSPVTGGWVPGFNKITDITGVSAAVASAAGLITPSGPLFHITGTLAVTGFNLPIGFTGGSFCAVPDGVFTTTNAANIAIASTAVVGRPICFTYDSSTAKFYPSY